jgi:hypothetical protein
VTDVDHTSQRTMTPKNSLLAIVPVLLPGWFLLQSVLDSKGAVGEKAASTQLIAYVVVAVFGFVVTDSLIPNIQQYTLRKGICGKDMGKRGTPQAETLM